MHEAVAAAHSCFGPGLPWTRFRKQASLTTSCLLRPTSLFAGLLDYHLTSLLGPWAREKVLPFCPPGVHLPLLFMDALFLINASRTHCARSVNLELNATKCELLCSPHSLGRQALLPQLLRSSNLWQAPAPRYADRLLSAAR